MAAGFSDGSGNRLADLPPLSLSQQTVSKAPDHVGSFLVDQEGYYPVDEVTGLPFSILTYQTRQPIVWNGKTTNHHPWHQRTHPELEGEMHVGDQTKHDVLHRLNTLSLERLGGLAVRVSRVEKLEAALHAQAHKRFRNGIRTMPQSSEDKWAVALKNCAGVLPRQALDVTAPIGEELVTLSDEAYSQVTNDWRINIEQYVRGRPSGYQQQILGYFFLRYATRNNLADVSSVGRQFLSARREDQRLLFGYKLMQEAVEASVVPLEPAYELWKRQGRVRDGASDLRAVAWRHVMPEMVVAILPEIQARLKLVA